MQMEDDVKSIFVWTFVCLIFLVGAVVDQNVFLYSCSWFCVILVAWNMAESIDEKRMNKSEA